MLDCTGPSYSEVCLRPSKYSLTASTLLLFAAVFQVLPRLGTECLRVKLVTMWDKRQLTFSEVIILRQVEDVSSTLVCCRISFLE